MPQDPSIDSELPRLSSLIFRESAWSGSQMRSLVSRAAEGLHRLGVSQGSHVALLLRNCPELIIAQKAIRWLGASPVPVNWHAAVDESAYIIANCGASILIAQDDLVPDVEGIETIVVVPTDEPSRRVSRDGVGQVHDWTEVMAIGARGPSLGRAPTESIIYTSGTTGRPKGVLRAPATDSQRHAGQRMREMLYGLHSGARLMMTAPLYHAAPLQITDRVVDVGELVVVGERFDPEGFLRDIERHGITHTFAVPTMFTRILGLDESIRDRYDISSLEFVLHAGAPCPPSVKERMIALWGPILYEYYGSTELGPVTFCSSDQWLEHRGTVGRPMPGVELAFLDPLGRPGAQQPAEIAVRNDSYPDFTYVGDPASRTGLQRGSYVATGDIGYLDEQGYLFVCDRVGDMIISGGVNIYPAEIEAVIQEVEGVQDCAVFAIPDDDLGEAAAAVVQPASDGAVTVSEIHEHIESRLGRLKHPRVINLQQTLPRADNGKIKKRLLRAQFEEFETR